MRKKQKRALKHPQPAPGQAKYITCPLCRSSMLRDAFEVHARRRHQILNSDQAQALLAEHDGSLFNRLIRPITVGRVKQQRADISKWGNSNVPARFVQGGAPGTKR